MRIVQRLYFLVRGHSHTRFSPRDEMENFLCSNKLRNTEHCVKSKNDGITLRYRKIGNGPKIVYLANGVGTNFFMWLPVLKTMHVLYPQTFDEITLIAPFYRGLFSNDKFPCDKNVIVTLQNCAEDVRIVQDDLKCAQFEAIIGWSTGAQMALLLCSKYPKITKKLFLLNPSVGHTLHTVLQPFYPLPNFIGRAISRILHAILSSVRPLCDTSLWDYIRYVAYSELVFWFLTFGAFITGEPPEQPSFFHAYVYDLFATRDHTKHLLDLILALDADTPKGSTTLPHKSMIVSGLPDFITGVYHSFELDGGMPNSEHIMFTMGSHFVLIEWPREIGKLILRLIFEDKNYGI